VACVRRAQDIIHIITSHSRARTSFGSLDNLVIFKRYQAVTRQKIVIKGLFLTLTPPPCNVAPQALSRTQLPVFCLRFGQRPGDRKATVSVHIAASKITAVQKEDLPTEMFF